MADFIATCTSNGFMPTNLKKFEKEMNEKVKIVGEDIEVKFSRDGFVIYGYGWPCFYRPDDEDCLDEDSNVFDEFCKIVQRYLPKRKEFILQAVGHEKCRYPLSGWCLKITKSKIEQKDINI